MTTARSGWRRERALQRPTSNGLGGREAVAIEVFWSDRPFPHQARLPEPEAVGCP
jgi:hypothetical protein